MHACLCAFSTSTQTTILCIIMQMELWDDTEGDADQAEEDDLIGVVEYKTTLKGILQRETDNVTDEVCP